MSSTVICPDGAVRYSPTQKNYARILPPEERDPQATKGCAGTIGYCKCGVLTQLAIGARYWCSRCREKES